MLLLSVLLLSMALGMKVKGESGGVLVVGLDMAMGTNIVAKSRISDVRFVSVLLKSMFGGNNFWENIPHSIYISGGYSRTKLEQVRDKLQSFFFPELSYRVFRRSFPI